MTITIYTALYGGYDDLPEPVAQDVEVDWVCFTDDPSLRAAAWRIVVDPPRYDHPRLAAKWHKMLPHRALPDARLTVWIDANVVVDSRSFARESIAAVGSKGLAVWRHPHRDCIYQEAEEVLSTGRSSGASVRAQMEHYRSQGHPRHGGLFACRSIARDATHEAVGAVGGAWLGECERWSHRDQLSLPVVARRLGLEPAVFPHHLHRHHGLDAAACRLRSFGPARALARRLRVSSEQVGPASPAARGGAGRSRVYGFPSNPWFDIVPHRRGS